MNVPFLDECAIFGGICNFLRTVPFLRNVPFLEGCVIFGGMCHLWRNVTFLEERAIFGEM